MGQGHGKSRYGQSHAGSVKTAFSGLKRIIRRIMRKPPEDSYAYVMARTKPRPPYLRASAVAEREPD